MDAIGNLMQTLKVMILMLYYQMILVVKVHGNQSMELSSSLKKLQALLLQP